LNDNPCPPGRIVAFSATVDFSIVVQLSIDPTTKALQVETQTPILRIINPIVAGCDDLNWVYQLFLDSWDEEVRKAINDIIPAILPSLIKSVMGLPSSIQISMDPATYIDYQLTSLVTLPGSTMISATADVMMKATLYDPNSGVLVNRSWSDPSDEDAATLPPIICMKSSEPILEHKVRISSSVISGIIGIGEMTG
jgi:hypothetical protein